MLEVLFVGHCEMKAQTQTKVPDAVGEDGANGADGKVLVRDTWQFAAMCWRALPKKYFHKKNLPPGVHCFHKHSSFREAAINNPGFENIVGCVCLSVCPNWQIGGLADRTHTTHTTHKLANWQIGSWHTRTTRKLCLCLCA